MPRGPDLDFYKKVAEIFATENVGKAASFRLACQRMGRKVGDAPQAATRLFKNPTFKKMLRQAYQHAVYKDEPTEKEVLGGLRETWLRAAGKIPALAEDGTDKTMLLRNGVRVPNSELKDLKALSPEALAAKGIQEVFEYEYHPRVAIDALKLIGTHLEMFVDVKKDVTADDRAKQLAQGNARAQELRRQLENQKGGKLIQADRDEPEPGERLN